MKKSSFVILTAVAILVAAGFASLRLAENASSSAKAPAKASATACSDVRVFGHIESLARKGDHYELRFDPAWFLSGVTANRAALEDTGSSDVPNDNYVVEEGHRLLTYLVPSTAHVTVLARGAALDGSGFPSKAITVSQLAQLVNGQEPIELYESLESGFWMHVNGDTACSLEHQYRP